MSRVTQNVICILVIAFFAYIVFFMPGDGMKECKNSGYTTATCHKMINGG